MQIVPVAVPLEGQNLSSRTKVVGRLRDSSGLLLADKAPAVPDVVGRRTALAIQDRATARIPRPRLSEKAGPGTAGGGGEVSGGGGQGLGRRGVRLGATPHGPPSTFIKPGHEARGSKAPNAAGPPRQAEQDLPPVRGPIMVAFGFFLALCNKGRRNPHLSTPDNPRHRRPAQTTAKRGPGGSRVRPLADTETAGQASTANRPARDRCRRQPRSRPRNQGLDWRPEPRTVSRAKRRAPGLRQPTTKGSAG